MNKITFKGRQVFCDGVRVARIMGLREQSWNGPIGGYYIMIGDRPRESSRYDFPWYADAKAYCRSIGFLKDLQGTP